MREIGEREPTGRGHPLTGLLVAFVPAAAVMGTVALVAHGHTGDLVSDEADLAHLPVHYGIVSNLGLLLWCAAASVALLGSAVLRRRRAGDPTARFLLATGALTVGLLADDLLQLHDRVLPDDLGIPKLTVLAIYALAVLGVLWLQRDVIRRSERALLAVTLGCFAAWALLGRGPDYTGRWFLVASAKFAGICGWCTYLVRAAYRSLVAVEADDRGVPTVGAGPRSP